MQRICSEDNEIQTQNPARRRRKILAAVLFMAVVGGWAIYAGTREKGFEWPIFISTVQALDWRWLALSLAFSYATYVVRALRWAVLLEPLRPHPRFGKLLSATVIGFSAVTALGRAAEMVRPYLIANRENLPFSSQIAAWIVERIYDVLIALAVFGFALSQVSGSGAHLGMALSWALRAGGVVIGLGAAASLTVLFAMKYRSEHIQRWIPQALRFLSAHHLNKVEKLVEGFLNGVQCTKSQGATARLVAYTLLEWLLIAACYACVLKAFGSSMQMTLIDILILMGFVSFGSLVQLPAVGGGAQVTAMLVLTEVFGFSLEVATGLGLVLWVVSFVAILPVGVALALHEGLTWAGLRQAERGTLA